MDSKPWQVERCAKEINLLLQGHQRDNTTDPIFDWHGGILKRVWSLRGSQSICHEYRV
jgi:hypothetical protein